MLIMQRDEWDCGIAVIATLAPIGYRDAAEDTLYQSGKGVTVQNFVRALKVNGLNVRAYRGERSSPIAKIIREYGKEYGHYIAIDGDRILDPELGEFDFQDYPRRGWLTIYSFK